MNTHTLIHSSPQREWRVGINGKKGDGLFGFLGTVGIVFPLSHIYPTHISNPIFSPMGDF